MLKGAKEEETFGNGSASETLPGVPLSVPSSICVDLAMGWNRCWRWPEEMQLQQQPIIIILKSPLCLALG